MSEKIYAWLLKLYPLRFREHYGTSAMQLFRDRLRAERGILHRFRFWLDVIADLAISIPREHWRQNPAEPYVGGYRLSKEAVTAMSKRSAFVPAVVVSVFALLGLTTAWLGNSERVLLIAAYFPVVIHAVARFLFIGVFENRWRNYQLILETDRFHQKQHGRDVTLLRSEIVKINEDQDGLLVISFRGNRPATIWIPEGLTGYQQVREHLLHWTPFSQRRSLRLSDRRLVRSCIWSLLPALLLVRSLYWFLVVAVAYYGMILIEIMMNVVRPPRNSGLTLRRRGLALPPAAYMWRRFDHQCRQLPMLALIILPIVRAMVAMPR
jgi:hypothetical protein